MATLTHASARGAGMTGEEKFVIFASSLGTVFEWYDFYLYAILAPFFASVFFPTGNNTAALCPRSPPMQWDLWCARSALWCSAASATSSDANTPS